MEIAHHRWPLWLLYSAAFMVIAAFSFGVFMMANRTLIWNMDGVTQHYPLMLELHRLLTKSGLAGVTGWSWTFGLGADKLTTLAYYVLGDPFAYLLALLPTHLIEAGYGWFVILRLYASGLAFLAFTRCYTFKPFSRLLGALTYAFAGYSLMIGVHHPFFILPMIWLPLLFLGIDRVLHGKGWAFLGAITGLTVLSNFYFAYILGLGSLIYAVIRYLSLKEQGQLRVKLRPTIGRLSAAAVSGLLLAGILLVPSIIMMLGSTRTGSSFANGLWLYPASYYLKLGNTVLTTGNSLSYWAIFGMTGIAFLGCVYTLVHWRQYRPLAGTLVLVVIGLIFPAVAAFFNVFSTPSNRWLLLVTIPVGLATMVLLDHATQLSQLDRWWLGGSAAGLLAVVYLSNGLIFSNPARNLITYGLFLATVAILLGSIQQPARLTMTLIGILLSLNLINNAWGYYDPNASLQATQQLRKGDATAYIRDYYDGADRAVQREKTFSRSNTTSNFNLLRTVGNNMAMAHGLPGLMSYFSVQNGAVGQFSQDIQNSEYTMNSPIGQGDDRSSLNHLLGVKTIFAREDQVTDHAALPYGYHAEKKVYPEQTVYGLSNGVGTQRLTTSLNLPLVYTQPQALTAKQWDRLSAVNRERSLTQAAMTQTKMVGLKTARYHSPARTLDYSVTPDIVPVIDSPNKVVQYRLQQALAGQKKGLNDKQLDNYGSSITSPKLTVDQNGLISQKDEQKYAGQVQLNQHRTQLDQVLTANQQILQDTVTANQHGLRQLTSDVQGNQIKYTLTLKRPKQAQGTELYLALDGISAKRLTTAQQLQDQDNTSILGNTPRSNLTKLNDWRDAVQNPDMGDYWVKVKTRNETNSFSQFGVDNLSDYEPKHQVLLNLGYSKQRRQTIDVTFNATRRIDFKAVKLIAMPYSQSYDRQVHAAQQRGLKNTTVSANRVTGNLTTTRASVLTTSIPYTKGWQLKVDGRTTETQVVNDGFVGARLPAGEHHIQLTYHTPGFIMGCWLTLIGSIVLVVAGSWHWWRHPQHRH
ncbi:YfhO family protein [Levilactobacillus sp. N40-8-2]|uniref:YfhO family protein n=1 Tax=Levilactobacillus muriae TaxID=3238987 RepID=UPI0038B269C6